MIRLIGLLQRYFTCLNIKRWPTYTVDLENIAWSPDGRFIAVWESSMEYKILIYYPDGRLVSSYSAYDFGLGIKSVTWSPSSQFLVIGSYDQKVRFLNYYTWKSLIEYSHPSNLSVADVKIYKETIIRISFSIIRIICLG